MDYGVIKASVQNAYESYKYNNKKFYESMNDFYKNGKENPSVAKIIMRDTLEQIKTNTEKIISDVAVLPASKHIEYSMICGHEQLYQTALYTDLKVMEAENFYKKEKNYNSSDKALTTSKKEFYDVWQAKYPKTGEIREHIIDANRIFLDKVNGKASWQKKINIAKTVDEYKKDYPKTFYTRYFLLINHQIDKNGVTPSIKNKFKRTLYKMLLKGNFSFKK